MRKKEMNYFAELSDNEQSNLLHDALSKCKKNKKKLNGNNLLNELKRSIQRYERENKSRQQVRDYDYINKISKDEYVSLEILDKICTLLNCKIEDVIRHQP